MGINVSETLSGQKISVVNGYRNWRQCGMAEPWMHEALEDGAVIVAEGLPLVFKLKGKPSALCYEDHQLPDGTRLRRGAWYAPTGYSESIVIEAFKRGEGELLLLGIELAYMRDMEKAFSSKDFTLVSLLERTADYARNHPSRLNERFGRRGLSREEYLTAHGQTNWYQG